MSQPDLDDNLKRIKGVGTATESRLRKAGINSYASLARQTPETLGNLLGYPSTKQDILQGWIQEAKRITTQLNKKQRQRHPQTDISNRQRYATFTLEILLDNSDRVRRTQVVHVQSGEEKHWPTWEDMELANYIVQKAKIKMPSQPKAGKGQLKKGTVTTRDKTNSINRPSPEMKPDQTEASDMLPLSVSISELTLTALASNLHLKCLIRMSGSKAMEITTKQSHFVVEVLAFNLLTSEASILTICEGMLQPDQLKYSMSMLFPAPKIGRYLLETIALIPEVDAITIYRGPFLTTIP